MANPLIESIPLLLTVSGLVLIILEAMAPGAHLIVLGVALLAAGLVGVVLGPAASPFVLAGLVVLFGAAALWTYREFDFYGSKGIAQTSDSDSLKGKTGVVVDEVTGGSGRIKLEDGGFNPYFEARALHGTIPEDAEVVVVESGGGNVLTVQATDEFEKDEIDRELERELDTETDREGDRPSGS
jgi:membrane protein implicated in regulation of membrane protease activity